MITIEDRGLVAYTAAGGSLYISPGDNGAGNIIAHANLSDPEESAASNAHAAARAGDWNKAQILLDAAGFAVGVR